MKRFFAVAIIVTTALIIGSMTPAQATHAWGNYHWARSSNPFVVSLVDQTTYNAELIQASSNWSQSAILDTAIVSSCSKRCVSVQNGSYGLTGWIGLATIFIDPQTSHIYSGTVKLNDTYLVTRSASEQWPIYVMCQEIGHTLGLDHQDTGFRNSNLGTCMDYTNNPARDDGVGNNLRPNAHDYEELGIIYQHLDRRGRGHGQPASITYIIPAP